MEKICKGVEKRYEIFGVKNMNIIESSNRLFEELDKGIDSMENGRTVPHDKAMQMIREKLKEYTI